MPVPWILWVRVHDLCLMATCFTFFVLLVVRFAPWDSSGQGDQGDPSRRYAAATRYGYPKKFLAEYPTTKFQSSCNYPKLGGGFKYAFVFILIWGRFPSNIFQMGWNHQPEKCLFQKRIQIFWGCFDSLYIIFDHLTHQPWIFCEQQNFAAHLHKRQTFASFKL